MSEKHDERGRRKAGRHAGRRIGRLPGRRATGAVAVRPAIPPQRTPEHDALPHNVLPNNVLPDGLPTEARQARDIRIPARAEWSEERRGRWIAELLLATLILGTLSSLAMTVITRSPVWAISLVLCALVAVIVRGTMIGSTHSVVRLEGSNLTIQRGGHVELFNLADAFRLVETVDSPESPHWRLRLETVDGRIVELTPHHVDAEVLHHAVVYYRTRSEAMRAGGPNWWMFRD